MGSTSLIEFIDNICGGNVRVALDTVRGFFGSGHVDTGRIIRIQTEKGPYLVPLHEPLRAAIYGDSEHYDPTQSLIANLFDVAHSDPKEHFLVPIILSVLAVTARSNGTDAGFAETKRLYEHIQSLGFIPEQIDAALVRASRHKLVEATGRRGFGTNRDMPPALRATTIGIYHVERLPRYFAYVDAIVVDTPIFDRATRDSIGAVDTITERLERAEVFRQYLTRQWSSLDDRDTVFRWGRVSAALHADVLTIRRVLGRRPNRRR